MLPDERPQYPFVEELPKRLGGARRKSVFLDSAGRQWLFKPQSLAQTTVDVVAAAVARAAGVPSPTVYDAEFTWQEERRLGSVQPYIAFQKDGLDRDLSVLTDEQRRELQRHQVVDWLLGNVDAHREQFILVADGTIAGIDKSQTLRVFPHDRLEWDFCLWPINNRQPVYSYLFQGAQIGRYVLRPHVAIDFADNVTRRLSND